MNPIAYLLLFLYIDTAEIVSDSTAVKGCSKEKRRDYATLLVLEASTSDILPVVWKNNLSGHKKKNGKDMKVLKKEDYLHDEGKEERVVTERAYGSGVCADDCGGSWNGVGL